MLLSLLYAIGYPWLRDENILQANSPIGLCMDAASYLYLRKGASRTLFIKNSYFSDLGKYGNRLHMQCPRMREHVHRRCLFHTIAMCRQVL